MKQVYQNISISIKHLSILNETFSDDENFSDKDDHELYVENLQEIESISKKIGFASELYSEDDRQMKLADVLEYIFFSRGIFSLIDNKNQLIKKNIPDYLKLILRFVNLLMLYEVMTTDVRLRNTYLQNLRKKLKVLAKEKNLKKLLKWNKWVGLTEKETPRGAPNDYFDSLLPKTAGGLWHEMLVFAFLLKYNAGYIFPLLLHQKVISLDQKLSPPDLIILHKKTNRYYGIEIGNLKERQSGGFMALLMKITLKKKIKAIDPKASYSEVFEAVRQIKAVKINCERQEVIFRTEFPPKAHLAFQALGVAPPPRIISYQKRPSLVSRQDLPDLFSSTK